MATDRYGIYSASFTHAGGTLNLQQLRRQQITAGSRYRLIRPGGALNPAAYILSQANPVARFVTSDALTVMATVDIANGLACSGGHVMRYVKRVPGGGLSVTSSANFTQSTAKGFLHITRIDVDIDSETGAEVELEYIMLSADGTNPLTQTAGVDFTSAPAPSFMSQYFMGGCWSNAVQVPTLRRLTVSPGLNYVARRLDNGVFPQYNASSIHSRQPAIEMNFLNVAIPQSIGSFFTNALGATVSAYLQRGTTAADGRIALATTGHKAIDVASGSWTHDNIEVADEDDGSVTVGLMPTGALAARDAIAIGA